jgi:hypothetical protein
MFPSKKLVREILNSNFLKLVFQTSVLLAGYPVLTFRNLELEAALELTGRSGSASPVRSGADPM